MSEIIVKNLTKDYGNNKGIFDLSLHIKEGEVFGYLGPNGAGKTTTIRHLLGFLNADKGECNIGEYNCRKQADLIKRDLGYIPGEIAYFDDMTGLQFLMFMASLRGMKDLTKMNELITYFELDPKGKLKKMSKGMKQKIAIICAFMHNPSTLILDEPTSGLDPLMQNLFIQLIKKEKELGKTILMSSHSFEEVEKTCDRVGVIKEGRFVASFAVNELAQEMHKIYRITFKTQEEAKQFLTESFTIHSQDKNVVEVKIKENLQNLIFALKDYQVVDIDIHRQSLEDVFMTFYGGKEND